MSALLRHVALFATVFVVSLGCKGNIGVQPYLEGNAERERPPSPPNCDDPGIKPSDVPVRRITDRQYRNTVDRIFNGMITPGPDFPTTTTDADGYSTSPEANVVSLLGAEEIMRAAEDVGAQVVPMLGAILPCAATAANESCAQTFIADIGKRVFRRPVRAEEQTLLFGLFQQVAQDTPFAESIGVVLTAMLQMPGFLYLVEEGTGREIEPGIVALSPYEVASRLSYMFLDAAPDAALIAAAEDGRLDTAEGIGLEARRLLTDNGANAVLGRFHREWLDSGLLGIDDKDTTKFPMYDGVLADSLNQEIDRYIGHVMAELDGSFTAIMTSRETIVNQPLAALYGLDPSVSSGPDDWRRVTLDDERAGILSRASVLATHAHASETSPVFRGLMVRKRLLCQDLPAPPPAAQTSVPDFPDGSTVREQSDILIAEPDCGGCHRLMNPIGLGFEKFDALGKWRNTYTSGQTIDVNGYVLGSTDVAEFFGNADLSAALSTSKSVHECVARQWFRSSFGRREGLADKCSIESIRDRFIDSGLNVSALLVAVTQTDAFRYRRTAAMQDAAPQR